MRGLIVAAEPCGYGELEEILVESGKGLGVGRKIVFTENFSEPAYFF